MSKPKNNFEKRKFLDNLEKLLPVIDTNSYSFDTVFDFMAGEFKNNNDLITQITDMIIEKTVNQRIPTVVFYRILKQTIW